MEVTAYQLAERFVGVREVPGAGDNPQILAMLKLDDEWPDHDEVPWCSAFLNYVCWLLRLPRSKSLLARSWQRVGRAVAKEYLVVGYDVVVLSRGTDPTKGHAGFFAGWGEVDGAGRREVFLLGGNQSDSVSVRGFDSRRIVACRRLL